MRKSMFAALLVLIMLLSGCSDVSTAPTRNDKSELVTKTKLLPKPKAPRAFIPRKVMRAKLQKRVRHLKLPQG